MGHFEPTLSILGKNRSFLIFFFIQTKYHFAKFHKKKIADSKQLRQWFQQ